MACHIRAMTLDDYDAAVELWQCTENLEMSVTDDRDSMRRFFDRNPGLSSVAFAGDKLIGTILCSHDGRRGYLHHLAVDRRYRRKGIGCALVDRSLSLLAKEGIVLCNIFIIEENDPGITFWQHNGFNFLEHFGWMQRKTF